MIIQEFEKRKQEHIAFALKDSNQTVHLQEWDAVTLPHDALPEINFEEVRLQVQCFGKACSPFFIAGMTGGYPDALPLNEKMAFICDKRQWAFGMGSMRRFFLDKNNQELIFWQTLREKLPSLQLWGNLGLAQLIELPLESILEILERLQVQACAIHLNALQEVLQPEGTPFFQGGLEKLKAFLALAKIPIFLKETGCGFSGITLKKIADLKIAALDVSGTGGTHWGRIEGCRAPQNSLKAKASETFRNWGHSTVQSLKSAQKILPASIPLFASGGVRSGLDAAKCFFLGASMVGFAKPALEAVLENRLEYWMQQVEFELKVALFCTGCKTVEELRGQKEH